MADFTNTVSNAVPGLGTPSQRKSSFDNNQAAGSALYVLTFAPGIRKGVARVRTKGSITVPPTSPTSGVTTTSAKITCTDGTSAAVIMAEMGGIGIANEAIDLIQPFNIEAAATIFTLTLVTAAGAVFVDFEVSGGG